MRIFSSRPLPPFISGVLAIALAGLVTAQPALAGDRGLAHGAYQQTNLVSDIPGMARVTDSNLVNPWGLSSGPTTPIWVSDNGAGVSTLYDGAGNQVPLIVHIPGPGGTGNGTPTGTVFNPDASAFMITKGGATGPSRFLFATEDGTIAAWKGDADSNNALLAVDNSGGGAVYKGLAEATIATGSVLYAANFRAGTIDEFDAGFNPVNTPGAFMDPMIPAGFAPFNVQNLNGTLYVAYAKQDAAKHDDVAGPGNGFVDAFDTSGNLLHRIASGKTLNSPWGLALAPKSFGAFHGDLLVGNFGDGRINAFDLKKIRFRGELGDGHGGAVSIDGLWGLRFGNAGANSSPNTLYFSAGIGDEAHGLFGSIVPMEDD